jgi:putative ABC transport system permease protein
MVITDDLRKVEARGTLSQVFVGRLADGMTFDRMRIAISELADEWHKTYPEGYGEGGHTLTALPFVEYVAGQLRPITIALFAAVMFVLLIACANIASLQLVRAAGRAREIAVRAALGAGRGAIVRQLVVESGVLAIAGGVIGILIGWAGLSALAKLDLSQFPALKGLTLDSTVLAFTAGTVVLAGIAFGAAPAFRAARVDVNDSLRDSGRGSSAGARQHRFLRASVIVQNALTLLLLTGAALTIESLGKLMQVDPGFQAANVVTFNVSMPASRYPTHEAQYDFIAALDEQLAAIPGVQAVGFAAGVPFTSSGGSTHYKLANVPERDGEPQRHANQAWVYGDYFKALGIQIVRGRAFTPADYTSPQHVVIVDENLVRQSFGTRDPIGESIEHGPEGTIVGVARAVKSNDLTEEAHPLVYHVTAQFKIAGNTAIIRSTLPPDQVIKAARTVALRADPRLIIGSPTTLTKSVDDSLGARRLATWVIAGFAALSLVLALLGIYAVMSYVVSQRTREIGIRLALGAQRDQVAGMVLRDGAILAGAGLGIGVLLMVFAERLVHVLLYGIGVFNPSAIAIAVSLLGAITLIACWLPARRAVRVDPVVTLRSE